ncbi:pyridoxamine 5'-phosphate oxidase family protein [uncultured Algibacter sp.]|uniref:pyridoxamine 5'-phosphate oxidase family protein n=1 Tax=uncultured Algibacter sp. TaxID=298659 RepID=UPI0026384142|nr:pyridoxamine 5'-phosphate oxidase family protein [uncultured Algibacter sp.]
MRVLEKDDIIHVLQTNYIGYLSFISNNEPYVIPITYYYNKDEDCIISYSSEGHKIEAMRMNKSVSLGVTNIMSINNWESVLIRGTFEELVGTHAKHQLHKFSVGIKKIILIQENKAKQLISDFSSKIATKGLPIVFRIKVSEIIGKSREF